MFGHHPYVWMPPVCLETTIILDTPIYLDAPCMPGCPHMFGCTHCIFGCPHVFGCPHRFGHPLVCLDAPMYVWKMFGMTAVHIQHKESALCQTGGVHMLHIHLDTPICLEAPYVWISLIPLNAPIYLVASKHTGAAKHMEGIQTYRGYPNIWGIQPYRGVSTLRGHPNIWGHPNMGGVQTWGVQTYRWAFKHMGVSKQTGGASKHMVVSKHTGGIQIYRGYPNIWEI